MREHLEHFLSFTRDNYAKPLPQYVDREFRNYLPCGPIPDWAVGTDPESDLHGYERGPPDAFEGVDPPCPDEVFDE